MTFVPHQFVLYYYFFLFTLLNCCGSNISIIIKKSVIKLEMFNNTTNNSRLSTECRIALTFKAQKMQASPRQK